MSYLKLSSESDAVICQICQILDAYFDEAKRQCEPNYFTVVLNTVATRRNKAPFSEFTGSKVGV